MSDTTVYRPIVDSAVATCIDTIFKTPAGKAVDTTYKQITYKQQIGIRVILDTMDHIAYYKCPFCPTCPDPVIAEMKMGCPVCGLVRYDALDIFSYKLSTIQCPHCGTAYSDSRTYTFYWGYNRLRVYTTPKEAEDSYWPRL